MFKRFKKIYHSINRSNTQYYLSFRSKGDVYFSTAFVLSNSVEDYQYLALYIDSENNRLGFQFTLDGDEDSYVLSRTKERIPLLCRMGSIKQQYPELFAMLQGKHKPEESQEKDKFFIISEQTKL